MLSRNNYPQNKVDYFYSFFDDKSLKRYSSISNRDMSKSVKNKKMFSFPFSSFLSS